MSAELDVFRGASLGAAKLAASGAASLRVSTAELPQC